MLKAQDQRATGDRALHIIRVHSELIADGGPDHVGTVRVEPFLDEEIYLTKVDDAEINRQFFGFANPEASVPRGWHHPMTIPTESIRMVLEHGGHTDASDFSQSAAMRLQASIIFRRCAPPSPATRPSSDDPGDSR
jgi:hypothetical protein